MYEPHSSFDPPAKTDKTWRYMNFEKFVSMIKDSTLFLTRPDNFEDRFEGSITEFNVVERKRIAQNMFPGDMARQSDWLIKFSETSKQLKKFAFVNCWHLNEYESEAMWGIYANQGNGLAIQSTFSNIIKALEETEEAVYIGKVKYIDYRKDIIPEGNMFNSLLYKRKRFEHEAELRLIVSDISTWKEINKEKTSPGIPQTVDISELIPFKKMHINLNYLIQSIYIAPKASKTFMDLVRAVSVDYGYDFNIIQPGLDEIPNW